MKISELQKRIAAVGLIIVIVLTCVQIAPRNTQAQQAVVDAGNIAQATITAGATGATATATGASAGSLVIIAFNTTMGRIKSFILDRLLTAIAKAILHSITASVVDWINSGFKGSPAFMTNPEAFFLDAADQVTGQFISETGILSGLCAPFSIDIRANIALGTTQTSRYRYGCTLNTVIKNIENVPNNIYVNGRNINNINGVGDFMSGNFNAGGWDAFNTVMMDPQNDPYYAYQTARDDIAASIAARRNAVQFDLSLGSGLMSWKKCTPVPEGEPYVAKDGTQQYSAGTPDEETCTTETPGSAIASQLKQTLGVPVDELELANDMNAVINALVNQMVMQVLGAGLRSMSGGGSSGGTSYTQQIYETSLRDSQTSAANYYNQSSNQLTAPIQEYYNNYSNAQQSLRTSSNSLQAADQCLTGKYTAVSALMLKTVTSLTPQQEVGFMAYLQDNSFLARPNSYNYNQSNVQTQYGHYLTDMTIINTYVRSIYQKQLNDIQTRKTAINDSQGQIAAKLSYVEPKVAEGYANLAAAQNVNQELTTTNPDGGMAASTATAETAARLQAVGGPLEISRKDLTAIQTMSQGFVVDVNTYQNYCSSIVTN